MKNNKMIFEDKLPPKLPIYFSIEINDEIESVKSVNLGNARQLSEWKEYLLRALDYVSNPSIAWDYACRYKQLPNGSIRLKEVGYNIEYVIISDDNSCQICISKMDLKLEEYGLEPPDLAENHSQTQHGNMIISQSDICRIVESAVRKYLNRQILNEKFYNPATEPLIDGHVGEYEVLDGAEWEQILCDLPKKGWVEDIRMYSAMNKGGKTYCLYRRKDNGKYFFVEVFDDNKDDYLRVKQVRKNEVPFLFGITQFL